MQRTFKQNQERFLSLSKTRVKLKLDPIIIDILQILQYNIRSQLYYSFKHNNKPLTTLKKPLISTIQSLNLQEKISLYQQSINLFLQDRDQTLKINNFKTSGFLRKLKIWKKREIILQPDKKLLIIRKNLDKQINIPLCQIIPRRSKNNYKHGICLQFYKNNSSQIHIGFMQYSVSNELYDRLYKLCIQGWKDFVLSFVQTKMIKTARSNTQRIQKPQFKQIQTKNLKIQKFQYKQQIKAHQYKRQSITQKIILQQGLEQQNEQLHTQLIYQEQQRDILTAILPHFDISSLYQQMHYKQIAIHSNFIILKHLYQPNIYRLIMNLKIMPQKLFAIISDPRNMQIYHKQIQFSEIKTFIPSQNSALIYLKLKSFGITYRSRDFLFMRHACYRKDVGYIVADKHAENINFPPFLTIVRGVIKQCISVLREGVQQGSSILTMHIEMGNGGYVNESQDKQMVKQYIQGFGGINVLIQNKINIKSIFNSQYFSQPKQNLKTFQKLSSKPLKQLLIKQQQPPQFVKQQIIQQIITDQYNCLKKIYNLDPQDKGKPILWPPVNYHPIWKGQWIRQLPAGSIKFINQQKLSNQKKVLRFIIQKIGKNIASGKNILNISLPIDIFSTISNLQLFGKSYGYAPKLLQPAAKIISTLQQLKYVVTFILGTTVLYIDIQKPFNPILGQTYQGYLDGCPFYSQQVSHHPPISSVLLIGRGYKMYGSLQAKVKLNLNSAVGSNDGQLVIKFDNNQGQFRAVLGGGQLSGLITGDRKLNMVGKIIVYHQSSGLLCQIQFNPYNRGMFSYGSVQKPIDYIEGDIIKVDPIFFNNFKPRYLNPKKQQIRDNLGKFSGIWNQSIMFQNEIWLDFDKDIPHKLIQEKSPIPSHSSFRSDIKYRRQLNIVKSQSQKQRLQVIQRQDRKLREEFK